MRANQRTCRTKPGPVRLYAQFKRDFVFFWVLVPHRFVSRCRSFEEKYCLHPQDWNPEEGDSVFSRNVGTSRRIYTAPGPGTSSSSSSPWTHKISQFQSVLPWDRTATSANRIRSRVKFVPDVSVYLSAFCSQSSCVKSLPEDWMNCLRSLPAFPSTSIHIPKMACWIHHSRFFFTPTDWFFIKITLFYPLRRKQIIKAHKIN
jgi:hypothetical protein